MAIFHLDVKNISRSQGRSAVGAAAYRAGERLLDDRLGVAFDYANKKGVVFSEIMAPHDVPEWVHDRTQLWNAVESAEKRKDSRVAKEVLVALPKELSQEEQIELVRDYCQNQFVAKGMIADVNIHADNPENPHAHILLTTREIASDGFGLKNREWNKRELVIEQRKVWQDVANCHLHMAGHETRVDCRSLQERGIDLEPGLHLGMAPHHAKERGEGEDFTRYVEHMEIIRANGERLIRDPSAVIEKLTQQEAVFDNYGIAKLANQYSADLVQYNEVFAAIKDSKEIIALGKNEHGNDVFTTRKMIELEHQMLNNAFELDVKKGHKINLEVANNALEGKSLTASQQKAFSYLIEAGDLKILTGLAGTGKSHLMGVVRQAFEGSNYRVSGVCLSGIAAQGLQEGSGIASTTLDTRLLQWEQGNNLLTSKDILVVDEAGMVGTEKHERFLRYANDAGAKVILVHDPEQLGAIVAGSPSRTLAKHLGQVALTDVIRQKNPEMRQATYEFGTGKTVQALERYDALGALHTSAVDETVARRMLIEAWSADRLEGNSQLILAYTNENVRALNEMARQVRIGAGEIEKGEVYSVAKGQRSFSMGDKVYFLKNDNHLDVKNGSLGIIQAIEGGKHFHVKLDGKAQKVVSFNIQQYNHFDHGYAATIHKGQGVTVGHSYVLVSKDFDRHLAYVAFTRHEFNLQIFSHQKDFKDKEMLFNALSRERVKSMTVEFARARWIEPYNRHELNLSQHEMPQKQLAQERLDLKTLKEQLPEREFSFGRALERLKGRIQGIIRLSDNRQMLCVEQEGQTKLVPAIHELEKNVGYQANIQLGKEGQIHRCDIKESDKVSTIVENGKTLPPVDMKIEKQKSMQQDHQSSEQNRSTQKSLGDDFSV